MLFFTQPPATPDATIAKLLRSTTSARANNPLMAPVATGVTQAVASSYDSTTLTKYVDVLTHPTQFEYRGGKRTVSSGGTASYPVASVLPSTAGNLGSDKQAWGWSESFVTEASKLAIRMLSSAASGKGFQVLVDGQFINKSVVAYGVASGDAYVTLDFSSVRQNRTITIRGSVQDGFRGVYVSPNDEVAAPKAADKVIWLAGGDSYNEGQGASYPGSGAFARCAADLLFPNVDLRQVCVGGTGYINNASTRSVLVGQIPNWLSVNSDIQASDVDLITIGDGYNDYAYTPQAVGDAVASALATARGTFPTALVAVLGPWSGKRNNDATTLAIEAAISSAVSARRDQRMAFIPVSSAVPPWQTGTGNVGATTGAGNADFDVSSDGTHPTDAGHYALGYRLRNEVLAWLSSL